MDVLLELSASTFEQSRNDGYLNNSVNYKEDIRFLIERKDSVSNVIFVFGLCGSHTYQKKRLCVGVIG